MLGCREYCDFEGCMYVLELVCRAERQEIYGLRNKGILVCREYCDCEAVRPGFDKVE